MDTIHRSKNHSLQHVFERGEDLALHMEKRVLCSGPSQASLITGTQYILTSMSFTPLCSSGANVKLFIKTWCRNHNSYTNYKYTSIVCLS